MIARPILIFLLAATLCFAQDRRTTIPFPPEPPPPISADSSYDAQWQKYEKDLHAWEKQCAAITRHRRRRNFLVGWLVAAGTVIGTTLAMECDSFSGGCRR